MAKRVIDFGNYEEPTWEEYTGEDPPPNKWFNATAKNIAYMKEDDQLRVIFEITDGDFAGWGRGFYVPLDTDSDVYWKTHQLFKALQGGKTTNVAIDPDNQKSLDAFLAKAKPVKIKTREYNSSISINKVAPLLEAVPTTKAKATTAPTPAEPDDAEGDEPIEDYTAEELEEMETSELEEILTEEFEADLPAKPARDRTGSKYKKALVDAILEEQEADEDEDGEGDAEEDGDDFEDGFEEGDDDGEEPEPEPEPAPRARRSRTATKAAPAKAAPAKAAATTTRRRRS